MNYTWDFEIVLRHVSVLLTGLKGTLILTGGIVVRNAVRPVRGADQIA